MALEHLHNKVGKVGYAAAHADYIQRTGKYENSIENIEELECSGFGNMPAWSAHDPSFFWRAADEFERKNGTSYREFEIALPRELTPDQRKVLLEDFIKKELGTTHAYTYAIHCPEALDGGEQPHAHVQFSERRNDDIARDPDQYFKRFNSKKPELGGCKKGYGLRAGQTLTSAERKAELQALRHRWEVVCNQHLELAGSDVRIDMRSYRDRGIELQPEQHQGPRRWGELKRDPEAKQELEEKRDLHRAVIDPVREELAAVAVVRAEIENPTAEIIQIQTAREERQRAAEQAELEARADAELQRQIAAENAALEELRNEDMAKQKRVLGTIQKFPNAPKMWAQELVENGLTSADLHAAKDAYSRLPITQRDLRSSPIISERNRNWNNAEHAAQIAVEFEAAKLSEVRAAKAASEEHSGFSAFVFRSKGDRLRAEWQAAWDKYEAAQSDTTTKVAARDAAKKLLDRAPADAVKSIKSIRVEQFDTALQELQDIERKAERMQLIRTQAQEWKRTGLITLTDKQKRDWADFSAQEQQVIALYEINRAARRELSVMNFSNDTSNAQQIYIHSEQIHDVLEGREPRLTQSSIKSRLTPAQQVQALRDAAIEVVKRHAAPLVPRSPELEKVQQHTRQTLEPVTKTQKRGMDRGPR